MGAHLPKRFRIYMTALRLNKLFQFFISFFLGIVSAFLLKKLIQVKEYQKVIEINANSYKKIFEFNDDLENNFEESMKVLQYQRSNQIELTCDSFFNKKFKIPNLDSLYNNKYKILTVRNPLERIVSGYRDKMTRIIGPYYHKVAQYVLQRYKYLRKSNYTTEDIHNNKFPTFEDYINFLVDEENIPYQNDLHWASYFSLCNPCSHKYDIIIKLETLTEDSFFLRKILSVDKTDYELIIPPSKNPERYNFMAYYSNLSKSLLKKLYLKYKFDFEAFGYDFKFL